MTMEGMLTLSYAASGRVYTLECGTVTTVSDNIRVNVLQTPIPVYSANDAFAFDTGATENIQFNIMRRNPTNINDPTLPDLLPDNVPDIYDVIWSETNTAQWSNRVWKMALVSMIDRWQMKTDGVSIIFTPLVHTEDGTNLYQAPININGYLSNLSITYDISSFEVLKITLSVAVGSINKR